MLLLMMMLMLLLMMMVMMTMVIMMTVMAMMRDVPPAAPTQKPDGLLQSPWHNNLRKFMQ